MSMNADPEQFEQVRRLLALKRHEQPPPGYFNDFSARVAARIKAGEEGGRDTWFQRFWATLEAKPIFAGAFGASVCAVLISGILNSEEAGITGLSSTDGPLPAQTSSTLGIPAPAGTLTSWDNTQMASTNPISSWFNQYRLETRPASHNFTLPDGN